MSRRGLIWLLLLTLLPTVLMPSGGMLCVCKMLNGCCAGPVPGSPKPCCAAAENAAGKRARVAPTCRLCLTLPDSARVLASDDGRFERAFEATLAVVEVPLLLPPAVLEHGMPSFDLDRGAPRAVDPPRLAPLLI